MNASSTMNFQKYKFLFDNSPGALLEADFSSVAKLTKQLKKQTVTNVRQFLCEYPDIVKKTLRETEILEANQAAFALYGAKSKEELWENFFRVFTTNGLDLMTQQFISLIDGQSDFSGEFKYKAGKSYSRDVFLKARVLKGASDSLSQIIFAFQDITMWKQIERELKKQAQLDGLTKLLNHNTIMQRLEEEILRAKRYGLSLSCLMIDLDHFKVINDKFGHQGGDQILKRVATMIKNCVRTVDLVGRYGGDEFFIILPATKAENARYVAQRIQNIFANMIFKYPQSITFLISLSIGIAGYPSKKVKDAKDIIAFADKAMYTAKKSGRNRIAVA